MLITLAIISIVAALTIPSVITNYRKNQAATQLKKIYSQLNQAIQMASIDYGSPKTWDYCEFAQTSAGRKQFYEKYFKEYLRVVKEYPEGTSFIGKYKWLNGNNITTGYLNSAQIHNTNILADGTLIDFEPCIGSTKDQSILFHVDLNGVDNPPNTAGKDYFMFQLAKSTGKLGSWNSNPSKSDANSNCKKTQNGAYCAAKIMYDGWQIKYDW